MPFGARQDHQETGAGVHEIETDAGLPPPETVLVEDRHLPDHGLTFWPGRSRLQLGVIFGLPFVEGLQ